MTGVLVVLAVLSAIGGFLALPHFLEPLLPLPEVQVPHSSISRRRSSSSRSRWPSRALAGAAFLYRRRCRARRRDCASGFADDCIACSPASTSSTKLYDSLIGRPLQLDFRARLPEASATGCCSTAR